MFDNDDKNERNGRQQRHGSSSEIPFTGGVFGSMGDKRGQRVAGERSSSGEFDSSSARAATKSTGPHHNARYKAKLCKNWQRDGICPYYQKCQFAHGEAELLKWNQFRVRTMMQAKQPGNVAPPGGASSGPTCLPAARGKVVGSSRRGPTRGSSTEGEHPWISSRADAGQIQ